MCRLLPASRHDLLGAMGDDARMLADIAMRPLLPADLAGAHALSSAAHWPHRIEDWAMALALGHGVAATQGGTLVGTAMAWRYGMQVATLGMIIVAATLRGRGLGQALTQAAMAQIEDCTLVLHATQAGAGLYRRLGFAAGQQVLQHQGLVESVGLQTLAPGQSLRAPGGRDDSALAELDQAATGFDRAAMLVLLRAEAATIVLEHEGAARGFAVLRRFGRGHVIGPVIAPDAAGARALIAHHLAGQAGRFTRIDVPEQSGLAPWLRQLGLAPAGTARRMVRGTPPAVSGAPACFALASQALG